MKSDKPVWQVKFYGTRGSTPVCEPGYQQFGGNTTCIYTDLLTNDRSRSCVVFDAGTGIRRLGKDLTNGVLPKVEEIFIIMTHFHWDHIQGFPFFDPIYDSDQKISFFAPHTNMSDQRLREIFAVQMQREYFPVQLDNVGGCFTFLTRAGQTDALKSEGNTKLTYRQHKHPGGAFSYRLEAHGKSIVICTDLEHGETIDEDTVAFCEGADLLVHDAQYTDAELAEHQGWGHSSYNQAIEVAQRAGARQLILTHHDPDHDDLFLKRMEAECRAKFPACSLARDGMEVII